MKGTAAAQTPVIIAVGEIVDRPDDPGKALEPVALMAEALRRAAAETPAVLGALDSIDLVGQVTWRYRDPVALLCEKLSIGPARAQNASMGGETPIRLLHEAALRIARGDSAVAANERPIQLSALPNRRTLAGPKSTSAIAMLGSAAPSAAKAFTRPGASRP